MISHKHKCIFIHIPKTGGTSINTFFHPNVDFKYYSPDYDRLIGWCPKRKIFMQHATARQLLELDLVSEAQWTSYFKFAFIRNPWDRAYSGYSWIKNERGIEGNFKDYINKSGPFEATLRNESIKDYRGSHLIPQTQFFDLSGPYSIDFLGRYESLQSDMKTILTSLEIQSDFNIHENQSTTRKHYSLFYTNSNVQLVEKMFIDDITKLNYKFEDQRKGLPILRKLLMKIS